MSALPVREAGGSDSEMEGRQGFRVGAPRPEMPPWGAPPAAHLVEVPGAAAADAPTGGPGPQPVPESSASAPTGPLPGSAPGVSSPRGPEAEATTPPQPKAAPQEEGAASPTAATATTAAVPSAEAGPPPAEPATEGAAATAEAAVPEAAEPEVAAPEAAEAASTASTAAPPTEEEELEWEKLEAEDLRLSDWEHHLGDRIKPATARHADERAKLLLERELLQEQLQEARDREAAARQWEVEALKRHIAAEERMQAATDRERTALELADQVRKALAAVEAHEASVAALVAAAAKKEERLAAREAEEMARLQELQKREEEREAALRAREAKVEEILAERSASVGRIARWVGVVNPLLEALGANPIRVSEAPSPLGTALQVLDSTAARLRDVEAGIQDLLETEGREVARGTAEYILTSFRSHDPAIQLTPVLVGPLRTTAAAAREGVLEIVDMVAARLRRRPEPAESGSTSGAPEQ
ncbi:uncharacterized protein LOC112872912 [Panicum hallii]|uniref:uncharacterized protein LOC112872912 n=1 Tax=Panicum hallii TaxID=206008 RepID=UPI000DF4E1EF|nr:uncharacterized protein LOC112872912 [Panicum hallii]